MRKVQSIRFFLGIIPDLDDKRVWRAGDRVYEATVAKPWPSKFYYTGHAVRQEASRLWLLHPVNTLYVFRVSGCGTDATITSVIRYKPTSNDLVKHMEGRLRKR